MLISIIGKFDVYKNYLIVFENILFVVVYFLNGSYEKKLFWVVYLW